MDRAAGMAALGNPVTSFDVRRMALEAALRSSGGPVGADDLINRAKKIEEYLREELKEVQVK